MGPAVALVHGDLETAPVVVTPALEHRFEPPCRLKRPVAVCCVVQANEAQPIRVPHGDMQQERQGREHLLADQDDDPD